MDDERTAETLDPGADDLGIPDPDASTPDADDPAVLAELDRIVGQGGRDVEQAPTDPDHVGRDPDQIGTGAEDDIDALLRQYEGEVVPKAEFKRRLNQVIEQRNTSTNRLQELEPWQPVVDALRARGLTPEQIEQELEAARDGRDAYQQDPPGQQASPPPDEQFEQWANQELAAEGLQLQDLGAVERMGLRKTFEQEQRWAAAEQREAQREARALAAEWRSELAALEAEFPELKDGNTRADLLAAYEARYGLRPEREKFRGIIQRARKTYETLYRNQLAEAATTQRQEDGKRPATTGGGQPPAPGEDIARRAADASDEEFEKMERSLLRTLVGGRRR